MFSAHTTNGKQFFSLFIQFRFYHFTHISTLRCCGLFGLCNCEFILYVVFEPICINFISDISQKVNGFCSNLAICTFAYFSKQPVTQHNTNNSYKTTIYLFSLLSLSVFFLPISYCFYTNVKSHLASSILIVTKTTAIQLICALILLPLHTQT